MFSNDMFGRRPAFIGIARDYRIVKRSSLLYTLVVDRNRKPTKVFRPFKPRSICVFVVKETKQ